MRCLGCGRDRDEAERYCRGCGAAGDARVEARGLDEADELVGAGIAKVITGDGFLIVSLLLSATHTTASSALWLLLLIPAFYLFGRGFHDVFRAQQLRRRATAARSETSRPDALPPAQVLVADIVTETTTRDLAAVPGRRTTGPTGA